MTNNELAEKIQSLASRNCDNSRQQASAKGVLLVLKGALLGSRADELLMEVVMPWWEKVESSIKIKA